MSTQMRRRPTVLDYLLRAGDAFTASLELHTPHTTTEDETRAQRLATYADRCATLAARTAGRDPALFDQAVEARDMASRVLIVTTAIQTTRTAHRTPSNAA